MPLGGRGLLALLLGTSIPFLCRSEMKRWMTSLAPNRRTKFVSFTSRLLGESLTWKETLGQLWLGLMGS